MARPRIISAIIGASSKIEKVNKRTKVEFESTLEFLNFKSYKNQMQTQSV